MAITRTKTHTTDSHLVKRSTKTHTTDSYLSQLGGLTWATNDMFDYKRLRQKTLTVGTNTYLQKITDTYPGELIYNTDVKTSTGSFTQDVFYRRDSGNTFWGVPDVVESVELSTGQLTTTNTKAVVAGVRYYAPFTFTTTNSDLVGITGLEYNVSSGVAGNIHMGIDIINANPPTGNSTVLACISSEEAIGGAGSHKMVMNTPIILKTTGMFFGAWLCSSSATIYGGLTVAQDKYWKSSSPFNVYTYAVNLITNSAWDTPSVSVGIWQPYIKVYYKTYT